MNLRIGTIGIDRVRLTGFRLLDFDLTELKKKDVLFTTVPENDKQPFFVKGKPLTYLCIANDLKFNRLIFNHGKCSLDLTQDSFNLANESIEEHLQRINDLFFYVADTYKLKFDISDIAFSTIEINKTFQLEEKYQRYYRVLDFFKAIAPSKYTESNLFDGECSRTLYLRNSKRELKIYDKAEHLATKEQKFDVPSNLMRVEVTLNGQETIERELRSSKLTKINQSDIVFFWHKEIINSFVTPFESWVKESDNFLVGCIRHHQGRGWVARVIAELFDLEAENKYFLLDLVQIRKPIHTVFGSKNAIREYKKFADFSPNTFLRGDLERVKEVLNCLQFGRH